jgi:phosphoribosyl-AMP cyclohydrolase
MHLYLRTPSMTMTENSSEKLWPDFARAGGLLPAIAQDAQSGEVLMLAWMNEEAFRETLATGRAVYYSRSRQKLWRKGEESGHSQTVHGVYLDCDADTILIKVSQVGAACHEGYPTCFFRRVDGEGNVEIVQERLKSPDEIYSRTK